VTVTVKVRVVPSCAVTTVEIVFVPTFRLTAPLAVPDATTTVFTRIVARALAAVGVTVSEVVVFGTVAV
jgi:hypothetical protein